MTGSSYPVNLCIITYDPDGTTAGPGYTNSFAGVVTVQANITPNKNGELLVLVHEEGYNLTTDYTITVSCLAGKCGSGFPPCTLTDKLTYDAASSTLTMNFTVGNKYAGATWNAWLTYQSTLTSLFSVSQPITAGPGSPVPSTHSYTLSPEGKVGVLSTLTTPTNGMVCSSLAQAETGAP